MPKSLRRFTAVVLMVTMVVSGPMLRVYAAETVASSDELIAQAQASAQAARDKADALKASYEAQIQEHRAQQEAKIHSILDQQTTSAIPAPPVPSIQSEPEIAPPQSPSIDSESGANANDQNTGTASITGSGSDPAATAYNSNTQSDSTNTASNILTGEVNVENTNDTTYNSNYNGNNNTGWNQAISVNGNVTITSGDTNVTYMETTQLNINQTSFGGSVLGGTGGASSNTNTGSASYNSAGTAIDQTLNIDNQNTLDLDQVVNIDTDSGYNAAANVNGETLIGSGDANVTINVVNVANTNINADANFEFANYDIVDVQTEDIIIDFGVKETGSLTGGNDFDASSDASNTNTGADSTNEASMDQSYSANIVNFNEADIDQDLTIDVNTGGNLAIENNGNTTIESGDANIAVNVVNFVNSNLNNVTDVVVATINIFGDMYGNIILPDLSSDNTVPAPDYGASSADLTASNSNTGSESTNIADNTADFNTSVTNTNELDADATVDANLNTGINAFSAINGAVTLESGSTDSQTNIGTIGNINGTSLGTSDDIFWLLVVNDLGNWTGEILGFDDNYAIVDGFMFLQQPSTTGSASNQNTQSGSTNSATTGTTYDTTVENTNLADLDTNLTINANSGGNLLASINGDATIKSGDIKSSSNITNFANFNFDGKKVVVVFVNIFGNFFGDIIPDGYADQLCPDGSPKNAQGQCPTTPGDDLCPDGITHKDAQGQCPVPPVVSDLCPDGITHKDAQGQCPVPPVVSDLCPDGITHKDAQGQCPVPPVVSDLCPDGITHKDAQGQCPVGQVAGVTDTAPQLPALPRIILGGAAANNTLAESGMNLSLVFLLLGMTSIGYLTVAFVRRRAIYRRTI